MWITCGYLLDKLFLIFQQQQNSLLFSGFIHVDKYCSYFPRPGNSFFLAYFSDLRYYRVWKILI